MMWGNEGFCRNALHALGGWDAIWHTCWLESILYAGTRPPDYRAMGADSDSK